jgi:uncharacterized membrane protein
MIITRKHVFSFIFLSIFSAIQLISFSTYVAPARADDSLFNSQVGVNEIAPVYGNDQTNKTDIRTTIGKLIKGVLGFLAIIFLVLTIIAGFRYMTAAGNEEQTKKSVAQIRDAVIGLVIILAAWAISTFALRFVSRAVNNSVNL